MLLVALATLLATAAATSLGTDTTCDARPKDYGCPLKDFPAPVDGVIDQTKCASKSSRIMYWASEPKDLPEVYELFAGPETAKVTTYTPGKWMRIGLRVKAFERQYRGLLMYAVNKDGNKVGQWRFIDRARTFQTNTKNDMGHPISCEKSVMHTSAEIKPYFTEWRFRISAAEANGPIRFLALIKEGPANTGAFWYPNTLTLTKATKAAGLQTVFRGKRGEDCNTVCAARGGTCDASAMGDAPVGYMINNVEPYYNCKLPYLLNCDAQGMTSDGSLNCQYTSKEDCEKEKLTYTKPTCASKAETGVLGLRFCPCKGITARPTPAPTTTTTKKIVLPTVTTEGGNVPSPTTAPPSCVSGDAGCPCTPAGLCTDGAYECTNAKCSKKGGSVDPADSCAGKEGELTCPCDNGACSGDASKVRCKNDKCVSTKCLYGDVGCACTVDNNECTGNLECSSGICTRPSTDQCVGDAGCPCTQVGGCNSAELSCSDAQVCQLEVCVPGDLGCPCVAGRCSDSDKYECVSWEGSQICSFKEESSTTDPSVTSASNMALTALVAVVALFATAF